MFMVVRCFVFMTGIAELVPERLALGFFQRGALPVAGKGDGAVADFVPGEHRDSGWLAVDRARRQPMPA
jgi:hypothetical protein